MWNETEPQAEVINAAIADFVAAHPNATVTVEWKGRDVRTLVFPALDAGTQVDLFDSDPSYFYTSDPSKLLEISDFYSSKALDSDEIMAESIIGGLVTWDAAMARDTDLSGQNYTIPYAPYIVSFVYNKDLFAQAGIISAPTTWDELDDACAKLKAIDADPITAEANAYYDMLLSYYLVRAVGPEKCVALSDGKDGWDDPMVLQAFKAYEDFASKGYFSPSLETNQFPQGQDDLSLGKVGMYFNGSWLPAEQAAVAPEDFSWGQFAFPTVPNGVTGINDNTVGGQAFAVSANTDNAAAVIEFLRYVFSYNVQSIFPTFNAIPAIISVDWPPALTDSKAILQNLNSNINWAGGLGGDFINGVVNPEFMKVLLGQETAEQAITNIMK